MYLMLESNIRYGIIIINDSVKNVYFYRVSMNGFQYVGHFLGLGLKFRSWIIGVSRMCISEKIC